MIRKPLSNWHTREEIAEASARITLEIYELEIALARVLHNPAILKNYLDFCEMLRVTKLLFFQNDRQEPGVYDVGARVMLELARHFIGMIDAGPHPSAMAKELAKVRGGVVDTHIHEIQQRLSTPVDKRVDLDRERFGPDWEPIRVVRRDAPVGTAI